MPENITINIDASGRFGVFCDRVLVCPIGGKIPEYCLEKHCMVKFPSGLTLDCLGKDIEKFGANRR